MALLTEMIDKAFTKSTYKCVISNPAGKEETFRKIALSYLEDAYFIEKFTETQVFHERMEYTQAKEFILQRLNGAFRSFNSWNNDLEYIIRISKKGKATLSLKNVDSAPKEKRAHNDEKNYILKQGELIEPLVDMGIFTKEGKVVQSMYDKYKQINRFIEIINDEISKTNRKEISVLDFGCGKSYLTFILYYYLTEIRNIDSTIIGLDLKQGVIDKCNAAAKKYRYENLSFQTGDIGGYEPKGDVDLVVTLHACDTATDHALYNAIRWNAPMIFSVPCCQHELNEQIESETFALLMQYGIVKERFSSLLTDAVRANLLECCGYKTQLLEFVSLDHTPKNIMIRAVKRGSMNKRKKLEQVEAVMREFRVEPTLYRLLKGTYI